MTDRSRNRLGKTDYNFEWDPKIYDSNDWSGRNKNQPFFMQVQLHGGKLRGASERNIMPSQNMSVRTSGKSRIRKTFIYHLITPMTQFYGKIGPLTSIACESRTTMLDSSWIDCSREHLLDNTLILFFTDHGISHARGKQFLYDEGTHIPFIASGPNIAKSEIRTDLVEHIDFAALSLRAAGITPPSWMQGVDIFSTDYKPKAAVYGAHGIGAEKRRTASVRFEPKTISTSKTSIPTVHC